MKEAKFSSFVEHSVKKFKEPLKHGEWDCDLIDEETDREFEKLTHDRT